MLGVFSTKNILTRPEKGCPILLNGTMKVGSEMRKSKKRLSLRSTLNLLWFCSLTGLCLHA